jgi:transposase
MAVGYKLLQVIYMVLSKKEAYKDPGVDYEKLTVSRNAPRWLKALEKYGFLPNQAASQS